MAETVIFPLSESTGQDILAALVRIGSLLEDLVEIQENNSPSSSSDSTYTDGILSMNGDSIDNNGVISTDKTVDANGTLIC